MNLPDVAAPRLWLFDCDGVLLNSNDVKSRAFFDTALPYGAEVANAFVAAHRATGGVSRYEKWERFFPDFVGRDALPGEFEDVLSGFATRCRAALSSVEHDVAAERLLLAIKSAGGMAFVVSGGDEQELRDVLPGRPFGRLLDGIHGSPRTKHDIVQELLEGTAGFATPPVFVGDSLLDMQVASDFGCEPVFVHRWTDVEDPESVARAFCAASVDILADLLQECGGA